MRYLPLLIILNLPIFLKADSLYLYNDFETGQTVNICLSSYSTDLNGNCSMVGSTGNNYSANGSCNNLNITDGYIYNNGVCELDIISDHEQLNLTEEQWNFQIAILANMVGFTMYFLVSFLSILVMRR